MQLTEAELAEGRRLLEEADKEMAPLKAIAKAGEWVWGNRHALLADREEIAREAVREFADKVSAKLSRDGWNLLAREVTDMALEAGAYGDRGVTLGSEGRQ